MPDLTMYCPQCGAPQYGVKDSHEVHLELADPLNSSVVVTGYTNLTNALTSLRNLTGLELKDIRALLNELPAVVISGISAEQAELISADLIASGVLTEVKGSAGRPAEPEPEPEPEPAEEPVKEEVPEEPVKDDFDKEMEAFLAEDKKEPVPEETPAQPEEAPALTDEEFEKQMAEFLKG
ncbi:MAG: ribosomal protein L7/L12 [Solobacterium sp.]|nr:ribosomal protein L7/L12 [Solobacterium sp.]